MSLLGHAPRVTWAFVIFGGSENTTDDLFGKARNNVSLSSVTNVVGRRGRPAEVIGHRWSPTGDHRCRTAMSISGGRRNAPAAWRPGPRRRALRARPRGTADPAPAPGHRCPWPHGFRPSASAPAPPRLRHRR